MKILSRAAVACVLMVLAVPLTHGQDLSKYRTFSLGMTLADVTKQTEVKAAEVVAVHEHPALIQQLAWWPSPPFDSSQPVEPANRVLFSFYSGSLYRMLVTYDDSAIKGLTADDMVHLISTKYGTATKPVAEINFPTNASYEDKSEKVIARWEDPQYSVNLVRLSSRDTFGIVMFSKQADAQAAASIAESVKLEQQEAPEKDAAKVKKAADDLEGERQKNIKMFRP